MNEKPRIIAQIPARSGSQRVVRKNLRYLVDKPLLEYAINAAKGATLLDTIVVNSDGEDILQFAESHGVKGYLRPEELASDTATGDQFTYDFMKRFHADIVVLVNPACPLIESTDIDMVVEAFLKSDCDTMITSSSTQMPCFCGEDPVNVDLSGPMQPTQNNPKVSVLNWALAVWDVPSYLKNYEEEGHAYMGVRRAMFDIDPWKAVKISNESDFEFAQLLLSARQIAKIGEKMNQYWTHES